MSISLAGTKILRTVDGGYELHGTVSNLITWQDQRCSANFLSSLPASAGPISAGYGCASILWLQKNRPEYLSQFDFAGTISDFVVSMMCDLPEVAMSHQNAASWGYFDTSSCSWQTEVLEEAGFPTSLLPKLVSVGTKAGRTVGSVLGLPDDIPVYVAAGDSQCSVLSTQFDSHQAVLNIGTSCQLSFLPSSKSFMESTHIQSWPYKATKPLCVVASMNGGNALASFTRMLKSWLQELDVEVSEDTIWSKLSSMTVLESADTNNSVIINPHLLKERTTSAPETGASVTNILSHNISLPSVYQQLCVGLIRNIHEMCPAAYLLDNSISEIICTGSVFIRQPFMLSAVEQVYKNLKVSVSKTEINAAFGSILMTEER